MTTPDYPRLGTLAWVRTGNTWTATKSKRTFKIRPATRDEVIDHGGFLGSLTGKGMPDARALIVIHTPFPGDTKRRAPAAPEVVLNVGSLPHMKWEAERLALPARKGPPSRPALAKAFAQYTPGDRTERLPVLKDFGNGPGRTMAQARAAGNFYQIQSTDGQRREYTFPAARSPEEAAFFAMQRGATPGSVWTAWKLLPGGSIGAEVMESAGTVVIPAYTPRPGYRGGASSKTEKLPVREDTATLLARTKARHAKVKWDKVKKAFDKRYPAWDYVQPDDLRGVAEYADWLNQADEYVLNHTSLRSTWRYDDDTEALILLMRKGWSQRDSLIRYFGKPE